MLLLTLFQDRNVRCFLLSLQRNQPHPADPGGKLHHQDGAVQELVIPPPVPGGRGGAEHAGHPVRGRVRGGGGRQPAHPHREHVLGHAVALQQRQTALHHHREGVGLTGFNRFA